MDCSRPHQTGMPLPKIGINTPLKVVEQREGRETQSLLWAVGKSSGLSLAVFQTWKCLQGPPCGMSKDRGSPTVTQQFGSQVRAAQSPCSAEQPHLSRGSTLPSALPAWSAFLSVKIQWSSSGTKTLSSQTEAGITLPDSSAPSGLCLPLDFSCE